jgi:rhamnosyltransferase subunit B
MTAVCDLSGSKRILFASIGSLGDLHPCIALALELRRRGHGVTIASTPFYRDNIETLGFDFAPLRPNWDPTDKDLIARCENLKRGPEVLFCDLILPHIRDTYADLMLAAANADLMIAGELNFAAPLVAEKLGLPWASAILSPCSFFSAHDPSFLVNAPYLIHLRKAGWIVNRMILNSSQPFIRHWWTPVRRLRKSEGLRTKCNPVFRDKFSSHLVLALFSKHLASPQPDWPVHTVQPGFVFYDRPEMDSNLRTALESFIAKSDAPPIVFSLGSTAAHNPGQFYEVSISATKRLGRSAVLVGAGGAPTVIEPGILAVPYAPYSWIFPRAAAIVHQGGSGTTGQSMTAGKPTLIVPYGWDQPDNAMRIERLGAGLHLPRKAYIVDNAAEAIRRLLTEPQFAEKAAKIGQEIRAEDAASLACNAIERLLGLVAISD